jgi:uncharacterized protein (TIGR02996 family)
MSGDLAGAFLSDIATNPEDDTPRLVYADWLDENGDPERAAFIRAQCRLERIGRYDLERYDLEGEVERLLAKNKEKWLAPLAGITTEVEFARGFPDGITLSAEDFARKGEAAFAAAPTLRGLRVHPSIDGWDEMLTAPALGRARALDATNHRLGPERIRVLARSPLIGGLHRLGLGLNGVGEAAHDIAGSPHLASLRTLGLTACQVGNEGVAAVLRGTFQAGLRSLHLRANDVTDAAVAALARWDGSARLESLSFGEPRLGDEAAALFASGEWPGLRSLSLQLGAVTERGLRSLGRCPSLCGLHSLAFYKIGCGPVTGLTESPHLAGLESLTVYENPVSAGQMRPLADSPMLASLRRLYLNKPDTESLRAIVTAPATAGLRELSLGGGEEEAFFIVAGATHMTNLRKLTLCSIRPKGGGLRALLDAPHLAGLVYLNLSFNDLKAQDALAIAAAPYLGRVRKLDLCTFPPLPAEVIRTLEERFPVVKE